MLLTIFNPWRRIRELQVKLDHARNERAALAHALLRSTERYDKIRETNLQLRDALTLYRENA
jgi:hypothetical protein